MMTRDTDYSYLLTKIKDKVGVVQLNRPDVLNALNQQLMEELCNALEMFDRSEEVGAIILAGNRRAFAAGADISQMATATPVSMIKSSFIESWDRIQKITKPIIAAVSGYALGGGCELAMACDMIIASNSAKFGQPEINIGVIPGAGGTQRLTRAIGKALAMEMVLNGRFLSAEEAHNFGLVNHVVPEENFLDSAIVFAAEIADRAPIAIQFGKKAINVAFETSLQAGLAYERELFYTLFATEDQKEGMAAFINKRKAEWKGR